MLKNVVVSLCLAVAAFGQAKPAHPAKAAKPAAKLAATVPAAASPGLPSEDAVNAFMYQMIGYSPTATWKVADIRPTEIAGLAEVTVIITDQQGSNLNRFYVTADGKHAITGDIIPFGPKPFEEDRLKLEKGVNGPSRGPAKAPVTVVEFTDLQCPHCKQAAPIVEQVLAQEPAARFIFQNFPLPAHNWAEKAAGYVDCIGRNSGDAVWPFIQKTFEDQSNITEANADEKLKTIATAAGANAAETAACAVKPDTKARIEASLALGKSVHVTGTPAIFVNGRMLSGSVPADILKEIVDFAAAQAEKPETEKQ
jgi:protein-disulfide isomerase